MSWARGISTSLNHAFARTSPGSPGEGRSDPGLRRQDARSIEGGVSDFDPVAIFNSGQIADPGARPDIAALLGPRFDQPRGEPAAKTVIICAAPRTGSYELARLLTAAGIGVAHEYFNPSCAAAIAARWNLPANVLAESELGRYIDELRRRRSPGGVCAI